MNEAGKPDVTAREVLFVLAEKAWADGTNSFPSSELIADVTGLDVATIRRAIRRLEDAKLIERYDKRSRGAIVWRLNMSLTREVSHREQRALDEAARRAATAERVRRARVKKAAEKAAEEAAKASAAATRVTGTSPVTPPPDVGGVTRTDPVTSTHDGDDVTGSATACNRHSVRDVTGAVPPEPVREPPGGIGAAAARPQTPAASNLWLGSVGGSVTAQSDLETYAPYAHGYPREAPIGTCAHGKTAEPYADGSSRCSRCRVGMNGGLKIVGRTG